MMGLPAAGYMPRFWEEERPGEEILDATGMTIPVALWSYRWEYRSSDYSLLHLAAQLGNIEIINLLLDHDADLETTYLDIQGGDVMAAKTLFPETIDHAVPQRYRLRPRVRYTPLHCAVLASKTSAAKALLAAGASTESCTSVNKPSATAWMVPSTPLHLAAFLGNHELAEHLISEGFQPDPDEKDAFGATPLVYATIGQNLTTVGRFLLEQGASPRSLVSTNCTLLIEACWHGRFQDALILLNHCPDFKHPAATLVQPLHICCARTTDPSRMICGSTLLPTPQGSQDSARHDVVSRLLELGADIEEKVKLPGFGNATPLLLAAESGLTDIVKLLVDQGADVNESIISGRNALLAALSPKYDESHLETIMYLLDQGCDVNITNESGNTPLHALGELNTSRLRRISPEDEEAIGSRLVALGANIHARSKATSMSVFQAFCKLGSYKLCKLLARKGAAAFLDPVEILSIFQNLISDILAAHDKSEAPLLLELLLELDRPRAILSNPESFEFALSEGETLTAEYLLRRDCAISFKDETHGYALHRACHMGAVEIVQLLLERGADIHSPFENKAQHDGQGRPPIWFAMKYAAGSNAEIIRGQEKVLQLLKTLLRHGASLQDPSIGPTLLEVSIQRSEAKLLELVLKNYHSVPVDCFDSLLALSCDSTKRMCNPEVISVLLQHYQSQSHISLPTTIELPSQDDFRRAEAQTLLEWLIGTYRPLSFCPREDCDCGDNLLKCIVVLLSEGKLAPEQSYSTKAKQLLRASKQVLVRILKNSTSRMVARVDGTSPGGRGRTSRHCLEFIMDRLELSSVDLRTPSMKSLSLSTALS